MKCSDELTEKLEIDIEDEAKGVETVGCTVLSLIFFLVIVIELLWRWYKG